MKQVAEIIKKLQNTSGTNDKRALLKANIDNELLKKVLYYTYNPYMKYGLTKASIFPLFDGLEGEPMDIFMRLDILANSNINDKLRKEFNIHLGRVDEDIRNLYIGMATKDLRIGVNAKTINKVWKGLVPMFNVQLAESFGKKTVPENVPFYVTTKLDGFRILAVPNEDGVYDFYTRKGEKYEGLDHLQEECQLVGMGTFVLDGELIARNDNNLASGDLYKVTTKIARKKGRTKDKMKLQFHCFDIVDAIEFKEGESYATYNQRRILLDEMFEEYKTDLHNLIKVEVLYEGTDQSIIPTITANLEEQGLEGAMINLANARYKCKRHDGILKVKSFKDADVWVKSVYEGTGRNEGRLGGVVIQYLYNGEFQECECGSGFTDKHRIDFWSNPELILGHVIEIQYFETTTNEKGGVGLRFPTFKNRFRDDKTHEDITDVAIV